MPSIGKGYIYRKYIGMNITPKFLLQDFQLFVWGKSSNMVSSQEFLQSKIQKIKCHCFPSKIKMLNFVQETKPLMAPGIAAISGQAAVISSKVNINWLSLHKSL